MKPPYFGYFDIGRQSTAKTFEECLQLKVKSMTSTSS